MAAPTAPDRRTPSARPGGIVTPEAVVLEFAEAGIGSRSLGFLVDLGVRGALLYSVVFALGAAGLVLDDTLVVVLLAATGFGVVLVYPVVCETLWNGRTPGKMLLGLRVVTVEGAPVRFRHAAIRAALGIVDFVVGAGCVAIIAALATRQSQRLGDIAAGTIVIRDRQADRSSQPVIFRPLPGWEAYASSLEVSRLTDDAYGLVRSFLLRVTQLRPDARAARAGELAATVAALIGAHLPPGTDAEGFLVAVAAAYQERHGSSVPPPAPGPPVRPTTTGGGWVDDEPSPTWGTPSPPP